MTDSSNAAIHFRTIPYTLDGVTMQGVLAADSAQKGKRPGVLVVHEWWGRTPFVEDRAHALAELGYVGFALDLFGDAKQTDNPTDASAMSQEVGGNLPLLTQRFVAALHALKSQPEVDPDKIAVIGYCFGGTVALSMIRQGINAAALVTFHAGVSSLAPIVHEPITTPIHMFTGGNDPFVPTEQVMAVEDEMKKAGANIQVTIYPNAQHSFTNPAATAKGKQFDLPLVYDDVLAKDSWNQMHQFFREKFGV